MFLGGETGKIEVKGGAGDAVYGGGGAGGRIAVYHYHDIDAMAGYRGEFNTEGGTGAEPGASGTCIGRMFTMFLVYHLTYFCVNIRNGARRSH